MDNLWEVATDWKYANWRRSVYEDVRDFFNKEWRIIKREWWPEIRITNTWIKKNIYEAYKKKNPSLKENFAAFRLLSKVIKDWEQINIEYNRKGYWADTYMYAAPILIDWKRYICTVAVNKKIWWDDFNYYLHEVGKDSDWQ